MCFSLICFEHILPSATMFSGENSHRFDPRNSSKRPYGVGLLVAGCDEKGPHLYETCPSGNYFEYYAMAPWASLGCWGCFTQHTEMLSLWWFMNPCAYIHTYIYKCVRMGAFQNELDIVAGYHCRIVHGDRR